MNTPHLDTPTDKGTRQPVPLKPRAVKRTKRKMRPTFEPRGALSRAHNNQGDRPNVSDYEQLFFPEWMDYDPASKGPNYLGYTVTILVVALLLQFVILAIILGW